MQGVQEKKAALRIPNYPQKIDDIHDIWHPRLKHALLHIRSTIKNNASGIQDSRLFAKIYDIHDI